MKNFPALFSALISRQAALITASFFSMGGRIRSIFPTISAKICFRASAALPCQSCRQTTISAVEREAMRSSPAVPSCFIQYQIPGLSDFGHFIIVTRLSLVDVLWTASCGGLQNDRLQVAYDLFASALAKERTLDQDLVETTIPSLVAEAVRKYGWIQWNGPVDDPQLLRRVKERVSGAIARWTASLPRTLGLIQPIRSAITSGDLPLQAHGEPEDIEARRSQRKAAIQVYKNRNSTKHRRVTDILIASEAGWSDRTPVTRFKCCDPRNTSGDDNRIWRVLRGQPRQLGAATPPK